MKKQVFIFIILIILVIAGVKIFTAKKPSKKVITPEKKKVLSEKITEVSVKVEPFGELNYFPDTITVYFSEPLPGTKGVIIDKNEISNYIAISPEAELKGRWINSNTFLIDILSNLKPDTVYTVSVKAIPLKRKLNFKLIKSQAKFKTPDLKPLSANIIGLSKKIARLKVRFNFEVSLSSLKDNIKITDKEGNTLPVKSINYLYEYKKPLKDTVIINFPVSKAGVYTLVVRKGVKSVSGFSSTKDFSLKFSAGYSTLPIIVKETRVKDLGDFFSINFRLITLKNKPVLLKKEGIENYITISPEVKFDAYPTKGNLTITGKFLPGNNYTVILFSGLKGTGGEVLKNNFKASVSIPNHSPKLMFLYKGRYFGTKGEWKFPLVARRLKEVKLNLYFIPERNITLWYSYAGANNWDIESFSKTILEDYPIKLNPSSGGLYFIDLKKLIPEVKQGIYVLKARGYSKELERNYRDIAKFSISNLSIIAKWNKEHVYVWVVNSNNAEPVKNAKVKIYNYSNIVKGEATTDDNGFAKVKITGKKDCYLITAKSNSDWNYLKLGDSTLPTSNFSISGDNPKRDYIGYLYLERDLFRPGERVNFGVIVRKNKTYSALSIPVKVIITNPEGKVVKQLKGITDKNGFAEFNFKTLASWLTGKYTFNLYIADNFVYSTSAFIEAFAPERMSIKVKFPEKINLKQPFTIDAEAFYLFGAPASGEKLSGSVELAETYFSPEGYKNYSFGPLDYYYKKARVEKSIDPIKLGKDGKAKIQLFFKSLPEFYNPVNLKLYLEVSEAGSGRATRKVFTKTIYPREYFIGLNCGASKVTANVPLKIKGVVLKATGEKAKTPQKITYRVYRVVYTYDYYYSDEFSWRSNSTLIPLTKEKETLVKNGRFDIVYIPSSSYDDIVVEVRGYNTFSQIFINGWGWFDSSKAETPETLILKSDKKQYDENDKATITTPLPFEGKILWTVETDRVLTYKWQQAKGKVSTFTFDVPEGYPCVYVSALLIHTGDNYLVSRAFGVKRVKITPARVNLNLEITAPDKIKPGSNLKIKLKGNEEFEATISIVDEGILQITNFKSPDSLKGILRPIGLGLESAEGFGWLVKKYLATGGGMAQQKKGFAQPQFTKIVSIWSGKLRSNPDGSLTYSVKIPQYNGKLRVMVCAASKNKLGGVSKDVIVKSDVIAIPTIPRFLTVKDRFEIPITLINTTEKTVNGKVKAAITNANIKEFNKGFSLKPEGKKTLFIPLVAGERPGDFEIKITVFKEGEREYFEGFKIPVFPSTTASTITKSLAINVKKTNIKQFFDQFENLGYEGEIYVSTIPGINKLSLAKTLLGYPYGCIEQVSSKTLAMIKLEKLLPLIDREITLERYRNYVQSGIGKILSMQTYAGGFAYWPGETYPEKWASIYATHVLIEAKKSGFQVPEDSIKAALNYIQSLEEIPPFGIFVLSEGNRLQKDPALIQQVEEIVNREKLDLTSLMWYCSALYNCGKSGIAQQLYLRGLSMKPENSQKLEGDFYTPIKCEAIRIYTGEYINYDKNLISRLIERLALRLSTYEMPYYYTTQELAWSMLAIGNFVNKYVKDVSFNATLTVDGKEIKGRFENGVYKFTAFNLPEKQDVILSCNKTPFFVEIIHHGYLKNAVVKKEANGINISEKLLDFKTGKEIQSLKQGEIAILKITVKSDGNYYPNSAVEIPLAGGLEAENPRLNSESLPDWADYNFTPDYLDIRDEKIIAFTTITETEQSIYLIVRGVTPGKFYLAPAFATVMYKPFINGRANPRKITVEKANGF